jgi:hypothetical protein
MKIRAYILTKGREVLVEEIDDYRDYFSLGSHLYYLDRKAVALTSKYGKLNPTPEVIYFEGVPIPVGCSESKSLLDDVVADNFLRQFGEGLGVFGFFKNLYLKLKSSDPLKFFTWVIILIIIVYLAYSLLGSLLTGGKLI